MNREKKDFGMDNKAEEKLDIKKEIISWIKTFVVAIIAVLIITQVLIVNARVPSGSMENTIMTGDRLIGLRFLYWFDGPERGDIVLFKYPLDEKKVYIKRVIGLPGETVNISEGKVYIDGSEEPLVEEYINGEWFLDNDGFEFEVPQDCYFVMGDNRNNSADGRYWASIALQEGKASTLEEAWNYSFVNRKKILAKGVFRYFRKPGVLK